MTDAGTFISEAPGGVIMNDRFDPRQIFSLRHSPRFTKLLNSPSAPNISEQLKFLLSVVASQNGSLQCRPTSPSPSEKIFLTTSEKPMTYISPRFSSGIGWKDAGTCPWRAVALTQELNDHFVFIFTDSPTESSVEALEGELEDYRLENDRFKFTIIW